MPVGLSHIVHQNNPIPNMNKPIALALLVGGIVLLIFGINATNSFNSDVSRFFSGSPTDKAVWMMVGGAILSVVGLVGALRGSRT
jgi:Protein of unknown function (DUF3185)